MVGIFMTVTEFDPRSREGVSQASDGKTVSFRMTDAVSPYGTRKGVKFQSPPQSVIAAPEVGGVIFGRCVLDLREGGFKAVSWSHAEDYYNAAKAADRCRNFQKGRRRTDLRQP